MSGTQVSNYAMGRSTPEVPSSSAPTPPAAGPAPAGNGLSPELQADFKLLTDFMQSQQQPGGVSGYARGAATPDTAQPYKQVPPPVPPQPPASPAAPGAPAAPPRVSTMPGGGPLTQQGLAAVPNEKKAEVMGALGRLLLAGSDRLKGSGAGGDSSTGKPAELSPVGDVAKPDAAKPFKVADAKTDAKTSKVDDAKPAAKPNSESFDRAFAAARKAKGPGKTFTWNGKSYTTDLASEVKRKGVKALMPGDKSADALNATELLKIRGQT